MESRTRLAIGGMTTVAASIAVVCAVSMTTSTALVDSDGATIAARPVVVPTSAASPTPIPAPTAVPATPPPAALLPVEAETVPAPEPEDITAPPAAESSVAEPSAETEDQLAVAVAASGSWDVVYAWADEHGWSRMRTEAWIARLDAKIARDRANQVPGTPPLQDSGQLVYEDADRRLSEDADRLVSHDADRLVSEDADRTVNDEVDRPVSEDAGRLVASDAPAAGRVDPPAPAPADKTSERDHSGPPFGSKRERSQVPPN